MDNYSHGGDVFTKKITHDFSISINPFGTPTEIVLAVKNSLNDIAKYPDYKSRKLITMLAKFHNVKDNQILLGNGASELIYALANVETIRTACVIEPTFSEYGTSFAKFGKQVYNFLPNDIFNFKEDDFKNLPLADIYFLCNPVNPTGQLYEKKFIEKFMKYVYSIDKILFVDECFMEFVEKNQSVIDLVATNNNLIVLQSFTKSFAIAGVRLGYMLTSNSKIHDDILSKLPPWNISSIAQVCGETALLKCSDLSQMRAMLKIERKFLTDELKSFGFEVFQSNTNFILFRCGFDLKTPLEKREILIRDASNFYGLNGFIYRICVKQNSENMELTKNIREIIVCQQNQ